MYTLLIADDEKIERDGIKFLLQNYTEQLEIIEAINGKQACEILSRKKVDILLTDIKMPFMNGIELAKKARELHPNLRIILFSGYSEFEYAREAIQMGVLDYILKPVNPEEFDLVIKKIIKNIQAELSSSMAQKKKLAFMEEHIFLGYLGGKDLSTLEQKTGQKLQLGFLEKWGRMLLVETESNFFERHAEEVQEVLKKELQIEFYYLNLNIEQSLLLFEKGINVDYKVLCEHIVRFMEEHYKETIYIALSKEIKEAEQLPKAFNELEELIENKFYQPNLRFFISEDLMSGNDKTQIEMKLTKLISNDIKLKDIFHLGEHFKLLCNHYENPSNYSQLYVKFIFSNIVKEIYLVMEKEEEVGLNNAIEAIYRSEKISQVIAVTKKSIAQLEESLLSNKKNLRSEVDAVKAYIYQHYQEDLSINLLAEKVYLAPGYLSYIFKKETGENLSKFIKRHRMEQAKYLLENTYMKITQVCAEVGFSNVSYFCQSFREYFGISPDRYRKGTDNVDEVDSVC